MEEKVEVNGNEEVSHEATDKVEQPVEKKPKVDGMRWHTF